MQFWVGLLDPQPEPALDSGRESDGGTTAAHAPVATPRSSGAALRRLTSAIVRALPESGLYVLESERLWCLLDAGRTCPDALPGHGQADALSIEVWLDGERLISDPGVHEYTGAWREWGRSSRAHSTVTVDDADDAEVYGSFRVGSRPEVVAVRSAAGSISATIRTAAGARLHRTLRITGIDGQRLEITDRVEAPLGAVVASRLHVAPGVVTRLDGGSGRRARLETPKGGRIVAVSEQAIELEGGVASTEFGEAAPTVLLAQRARTSGGRAKADARLCWSLEAAAKGFGKSALRTSPARPGRG